MSAKQVYVAVAPKTDGSSLPLKRLSSSAQKRVSTCRGEWYSWILSISPAGSRVKMVAPRTSSPKTFPSHSRYVLPRSTVSFVNVIVSYILLATPKKAPIDSAPTQGLRKTDAVSIGRSTKAAANSGDPFLPTIAIQSVPG